MCIGFATFLIITLYNLQEMIIYVNINDLVSSWQSLVHHLLTPPICINLFDFIALLTTLLSPKLNLNTFKTISV